MKQETITNAATVEEALEEALEQLEAQRDEVDFEVLEEPSKKLFGGKTDARLRVWLLDDSSNEEEEEILGEETEGEDDEGPDDRAGKDEEHNYNEAQQELSEEDLDTIADAAIETIRELLVYFGIEDAEVEEYEGDEGELILDIVGDNLAVLIGRHGKTLDSLQFIVSSIVTKKTGLRHPVVIDIEGYKHRRKQKLISIAKASAARVIRQKHEVRLRPMTPYERRIVHITLRGDKRVVTSSEGVEPSRYIVIRPS